MKLERKNKLAAAQATHSCCGAQRPESAVGVAGTKAIEEMASTASTVAGITLPGGHFLMGTDLVHAHMPATKEE